MFDGAKVLRYFEQIVTQKSVVFTFFSYLCRIISMNNKSIIIEDNLHRLGSEELQHCIAHVLCQAGRYTFEYNGENFVLEAGQTMK